MSNRYSINQVSVLELTMRDSLEGLTDLASEFAYQSMPGEFEIISIEAPSEKSALPVAELSRFNTE